MEEEIQIWQVWLDQTPSAVKSLLQALSPDERRRAERFYFQKDRDHYIVTRGALRNILGHRLGVNPGYLQFCYNSYGKPALAPETVGKRLKFNVSHSHGLAILAVTGGREIGVDIELVRQDFSIMEIAQRFFSQREISALVALSPEARPEAFFNCWTRKEAYVKARGTGLSFPLDQFTVSLAPGEPAALLDVVGDSEEVGRWSLFQMPLSPGYVGAVAVQNNQDFPKVLAATLST
jgi:4'-phosphopantetheinyl transferase